MGKNSMTSIEKANAQFVESGIPFPPVPEEMNANIVELSPWVFGTRKVKHGMYFIDTFINEVQSKNVDDYLLFGHDGHGLNSYALHYFLVYKRLAIFIQWGWGGIYMDNAKQLREIAILFDYVKRVIDLHESIPLNVLASPKRLLIVESDFVNSFWGVTTEGKMGHADKLSALTGALKWMETFGNI